nr:excisionase [uncultured Eisenbergiella sp.]
MTDKERVPLWEKYTLSINEAAQYFNIGEKKIRTLIEQDKDREYSMTNGSMVKIKRKMFEHFLDNTSSI